MCNQILIKCVKTLYWNSFFTYFCTLELIMHLSRIFLRICLVAGLCCPLSLFAQSDALKYVDRVLADDVDIIFSQDFENSTIGPYDLDEWRRDWNNPGWNNGVERQCHIVEHDGSKAFISYTPAGEWGLLGTDTDQMGGGFNWWAPIPGGPHEEIYMSYNIYFRPGVEFPISGKLPGLLAGDQSMDPGRAPEYGEGFTAYLAFYGAKDPRGTIAFYCYNPDQYGDYGDMYFWYDPTNDDEDFYVVKETNLDERWINWTIRIVVNQPGEKNGIMEGFVNGELMYSKRNANLRSTSNTYIDKCRMSWFYGGSGEDFAPEVEEWIIIDDVMLFNYPPEADVPHGREPSPAGRVLDLPWMRGEPVNPETDSDPPSVPENVQTTAASSSTLSVTWDHSTDNEEVTGYRVFVNNVFDSAVTVNNYKIRNLIPEASYLIRVSAFDAASNQSDKSVPIIGITSKKDTESPTIPTDLFVSHVSGYSIEYTWTPSVDNVAVERYKLYLDDQWILDQPGTVYLAAGLDPDTEYKFAVRAVDADGNTSASSEAVYQYTTAPDEQAPTPPMGVTATDVTETTISVEWDPSSDNVAVTEYLVYFNNAVRETTSGIEETVAKLQPGLEYAIEISALDEAGNESDKSPALFVTTINEDETTQPTLPGIKILDVRDNTITPSSLSEMNALGFAQLRNYGLEITEKDQPGSAPVILKGLESSSVVHTLRYSEGLQVLYDFSEGAGNMVHDQSDSDDPLDLQIAREGITTEWLLGQGLRVNSSTTLSHGGAPDRLISALKSTDEITLEAWIKQEEVEQSGPARIISLSLDNSLRAATLGHVGNKASFNYAARLNTSAVDGNGNPDLLTSFDFTSLSLHHVVYTRAQDGQENLYVNGIPMANGTRSGDFSSWTEDYKLFLANETTGDRPWKGIFYLVAIYNKALDPDQVENNYSAGFGQIRFVTKLDTLTPNVEYQLTPFINTDQGIVFGEPKDFLYQNVALTDSLLSFYPNPSNGSFFLKIKNRDENLKSATLRVADFAGQVHYTTELDLSEGLLENDFYIELPPTLKSGFYALMLFSETRAVTEKLVIIK